MRSFCRERPPRRSAHMALKSGRNAAEGVPYNAICVAVLIASSFGCTGEKPSAAPASQNSAVQTITLQTTTSPRDSGLLDALLPAFRAESGIEVKVIAVGSGQALENARRGNGDVVVAHSPEAEEKFMADGFGVLRLPLMENDFIVVGPAADSAGLKSAKSAAEAFKLLSEKHGTFISRSDESGTHVKEKAVWKAAGIDPTSADAKSWYVQAGIGMAAALRMADEKQAYTLADRGTYLSQKAKLALVPLYSGDPVLLNQYSVIVVSAAKHPALNEAAARKFAESLTSAATKKRIAEFGVKEYGEPLFKPR